MIAEDLRPHMVPGWALVNYAILHIKKSATSILSAFQ
jgi:hypothetical protein